MRHVRAIEENGKEIGCVVIRGAGTSFCSGHDLSEVHQKDALGWLRLELLTLEKLTKLRQPVIAAVHGHCFTGGLEFAAWCPAGG
jgi:enoyl-CoA hydratase/carnithine racemase